MLKPAWVIFIFHKKKHVDVHKICIMFKIDLKKIKIKDEGSQSLYISQNIVCQIVNKDTKYVESILNETDFFEKNILDTHKILLMISCIKI